MKKPNKKALCIFTAILTVALIGLTLYFLNASQNVRSRLTDSELKVIDHFSLFDYETLSKEILEEKQFLIDEKQDISIHNSAEYTYKSLADNGVDDSGIEYALIIISDKGKIEDGNFGPTKQNKRLRLRKFWSCRFPLVTKAGKTLHLYVMTFFKIM